jgi:hypothetical protein
MATNNRSTAIVIAPPARRSGASAPQIIRMAVPMLYAAMGVSLGTLAGVATAFVSVPMASAAAVDNGSGTEQVGNSSGNQQMATLVLPTENARVSASNEGNAAAAKPVVEDSAAQRATKTEQAPEAERARTKAPSIEIDKTASPATAPTEKRPAQRPAHPVTRPLRTEVAAVPDATLPSQAAPPVQIEMDADQPAAPVDEAKSSSFYSEGDLTVADYNAAEGTIETSDGRIFELGETVTMGNTVAWDQYRSSVHYRCEQGGSCVLQRAGVVTINARQI